MIDVSDVTTAIHDAELVSIAVDRSNVRLGFQAAGRPEVQASFERVEQFLFVGSLTNVIASYVEAETLSSENLPALYKAVHQLYPNSSLGGEAYWQNLAEKREHTWLRFYSSWGGGFDIVFGKLEIRQSDTAKVFSNTPSPD